MSSDKPLRNPRQYSPGEIKALGAAGLSPERGPALYATGDWWPSELERRAGEVERMVPLLRLAASAMRREIEAGRHG